MTRTVEALATKAGSWWEVAIPELDQSTATKRRAEIQDYADNLAASVLGMDPGTVRVNVSYPLPEAVREEWEQARKDQRSAQELSVSAAGRIRDVVSTLHGSGYSGSDIAAVLGLSVQRVSQILKPKPE